MTMTQSTENGVTVLCLAGRLDTGTSGEAEKQILAVLETGAPKLLLDLSGVEFVSSAGLRVLLVVAKRMKAANGKLRLSGMNATVREVFEISGFTRLFDVHPDRAAALAGF
jgi:anti-anti-sigma factor